MRAPTAEQIARREARDKRRRKSQAISHLIADLAGGKSVDEELLEKLLRSMDPPPMRTPAFAGH